MVNVDMLTGFQDFTKYKVGRSDSLRQGEDSAHIRAHIYETHGATIIVLYFITRYDII